VRPEVRYARNGDVSLAYQVVGEGPADLVLVLGFVSHLEASWEEPRLASFLRRLASFNRLVVFDKRGCGMSDPALEPPTFEDRLSDLRAVMDAAGVERASLFGTSEGGGVAIRFAVARPQRVASVVAFGSFARALRTPDYPWGWSDGQFEDILSEIETTWLQGAELRNPSLQHDERYRRWFTRYLRLAASPGMLRDLMRANAAGDLRPVLPQVQQPTLVLHRRGDVWVKVEHGRYLASQIPNARLVELEGADHWPWIGDAEPVLAEVQAFLTGTRPRHTRRPRFGLEALTPRERQMVRLTVEGRTAPDIARLLFVSERTVETHLARARSKLGVASRLELIRAAEALGV
jgi:pimeloyl-ACP methyl ester carboxylesterase/DNA-binding CsgD family transcriptional regulator